jgi:hypothetical protein
MQKKFSAMLVIFIILMAVVSFQAAFPVSANSSAQVYYFTPTAQPDGRILYTIKAGDTCISIALLNNITEDQLRLLNDLTGDACLFLREGSQLIIGVLEEQPTLGPQATATSILPSPTPFNGTGELCVMLFNDVNGNALIDDAVAEPPLSGGAISVTDRDGKVSLTDKTNNTEEVCFLDLAEGEYTISIAVPEGYNPTMRTNVTLKITAGDITAVDFGAQISLAGENLPTENNAKQRSPLLGIMGGLVLLFGVGFGVYALRLQKK